MSDQALPVAVGTKAPGGSTADQAWWAYCVVTSADAAAGSGLEGIEPGTWIEAVVDGELAALVSPVPLAEYDDQRLREHLEDIDWLERTARAHAAVLEGLLDQVAIVPLRLCTLYHDREGVRRMLHEHADALASSLMAVKGCSEWGVKVFLEDTREAPEASENDGRTHLRAGSGASYLAGLQRERRAVQERDEIAQQCVGEVHTSIANIARRVRLNPVQRPEAHGRQAEMILNGAYLVDDGRVNELSELLALLQASWSPRGMAVELTGPWPPYNFVADLAGAMS